MDADNQVLGRLAQVPIAPRQHRGTLHMDNGDVIVVVNYLKRSKVTGISWKKKKVLPSFRLCEAVCVKVHRATPCWRCRRALMRRHRAPEIVWCAVLLKVYAGPTHRILPGPEASVLPVLTRPGVNHV